MGKGWSERWGGAIGEAERGQGAEAGVVGQGAKAEGQGRGGGTGAGADQVHFWPVGGTVSERRYALTAESMQEEPRA